MKTYLLLFMLATGSSLALTPVVRRLCQRFDWLDEIRDLRRIHQSAVPRLGGIAVYLSVLIGLVPLLLLNNFFTASLRESNAHFLRIFVPATLTLLLGIFDDLRGLKALQKFAGLMLVAAVFYLMGGRIEALTIPFVGSIQLPAAVGFLITVVWIVGVANAFNLLDGMDGLAAGAAIFSSLVIMAISLMQGQPLVSAVTLVLTGALIGFLRYNFNPASIFLGDSGALLIGFLLAALSVEGSQKASTAVAIAIPLMAFGLPLVDTAFTLVRRFISRKPLFTGDREHIHHMLLERGWSQKRAVLVLYGVCAVFGLCTLLFVESSAHVTGVVLFVIGISVMLAVSHLRYHEIEEIKASVKRNVGDRRARGANNITVRRASRNLANATTLADLFAAVIEILEVGEFSQAVLILGETSNAAGNEAALRAALGSNSAHQAEMRDGMIWWTWQTIGVKTNGNGHNGHLGQNGQKVSNGNGQCGNLWSLRIPLVNGDLAWGHLNLYRAMGPDNILLDINYLCTLFQLELVKAVERLLAQKSDRKSMAAGA
jgi:UDP-GlcNAc:undecaprenyl-phosphate/decaprenyl-phosphate GlcNAc-1-phosphate transferase